MFTTKNLNMNKIIYFISLIFLMISCSKETEEEETTESSYGVFVSSSVHISYLNTKGEDLLDTNTVNYFPFEDMKLYYINNEGDKEEVYDGTKDFPRNMCLVGGTDPTMLTIFTDTDKDNMISENDSIMVGQSINILELNENISDTIVAEWYYYKDYAAFYISKFWYNGTMYNRKTYYCVMDTIRNR